MATFIKCSLYNFNMSDNRKSPNKHLISLLGNKCSACGSSKNLQVHHKIPLSKNGVDEVENLEVLCTLCHNKIHNYKKKTIDSPSVILRFRSKHDYYFALIKKYPEFEVNYSKAIRKAVKEKYPLDNKWE